MPDQGFNKKSFGQDFVWGVASSACQIEGGHAEGSKGRSIWDDFANRKRVQKGHTPKVATDFYHRFPEDLRLMGSLGIPHFRYSLSWPRILPKGKGQPNQEGLDFYHKVIDHCLENGIQPWLTLYHWDLPLALQKKGGWTNRAILGWFLDYLEICVKAFGDRVHHWMILNEPSVFTGGGYFLNMHAPGKMGLKKFLPALHHALLAQAEGGKLVKALAPKAKVGTTFSCTPIDPYRATQADEQAAKRVHTLVNRLCLEPLLGKGYPWAPVPFIRKVEKYMKANDERRLAFDFDFWGIQCYTREVVRHVPWIPYVRAFRISAKKRGKPAMANGWEINKEALYRMVSFFNNYDRVPELYVTENGAAFYDKVSNGRVKDAKRIECLKGNLQSLLKAKQEGIPVKGYFVWTFTDNFEWAEGYEPRFGVVHVDFETQKRVVKDSGHWLRQWLNEGKDW